VVPGETFEVETELNIGGHLITHLQARFKPTLHIPRRWIMGPHFLPCPIHDAIRPCCNDQTDC
jgi:hypothetical protein